MIFPEAIQARIEDYIGPIFTRQELSGMGGSSVWKLVANDRSMVLKRSSTSLESDFYGSVAPLLKLKRFRIPQVYFREAVNSDYWLGLEFIPHELPKSRWHFDQGILAALAELHEISIPNFSGFNYFWSEEMNELAATSLAAKNGESILKLWNRVRSNFQSILEPDVFVAGDPNGRNWGLSAENSLVLYDWERAGCASPAVDLMAVAFDQLTHEKFAQIASCYIDARGLRSVERLTWDIKAGRAYIISEILSKAARKEINVPIKILDYLVNTFPDWLKREFASLR